MNNFEEPGLRDRDIRPMPTIAQQLGVLIKETQAVLNQRMDQELRPLGLSVSQYACLQNLHDDAGITASELARRTFVSRQSVNVVLQGLIKRGLVDRSGAPGPRRERAAQLTPAGQDTLVKAQEAVAAVADAMVGDLGPAQQERLVELLAACRDGLSG